MFCAHRTVIKRALETLRCCSSSEICSENASRFIHTEVSLTKIHESVDRNRFSFINNTNRRHFITLAQFCKVNPIRSSALVTTVRYKKKSPKNINTNEEVDIDDDDDTDQYVEELDSGTVDDIGGKELTVRVPSLRIDTILKAGLNTSKAKLEEGYYQSRIRINGELAAKKSSMVGLGDEVDFIIGKNGMSDQYLDVSRLIVVAIRIPKETGTNITVKLRRHKNLTIENYKEKWSLKEE